MKITLNRMEHPHSPSRFRMATRQEMSRPLCLPLIHNNSDHRHFRPCRKTRASLFHQWVQIFRPTCRRRCNRIFRGSRSKPCWALPGNRRWRNRGLNPLKIYRPTPRRALGKMLGFRGPNKNSQGSRIRQNLWQDRGWLNSWGSRDTRHLTKCHPRNPRRSRVPWQFRGFSCHN